MTLPDTIQLTPGQIKYMMYYNCHQFKCSTWRYVVFPSQFFWSRYTVCVCSHDSLLHLFYETVLVCVCVTHPGRCCSSWRWSLGGAGPAEWNDIQTSAAWCSSPACWLSPSPPCFLTAGSGVQGESGEWGGRKKRYRDELKAGKSKDDYGRELECHNRGRKPGGRWKVQQRKKESFNKMNSRANSESHVFNYAVWHITIQSGVH